MKVLGIIPARGGSKRLPRKNIMPFLGRPLIAYTIEAARRCPGISKLICSTDDREIAKTSLVLGCEVSERSLTLAQDTSTLNDLVLTLMEGYDRVVVLQPTSPLRTTSDIECGLALGYSISVGPTGAPNGAVYVVDVSFFRDHPYFGGQVFYMPKERSVDIDTIEDFNLAAAYGIGSPK